MKIAFYNKEAKKIKDLEVKSPIFNTEPKALVLREAVLAFLAEQRNAHAKTKKREEVSGGGRKPWRQKGTGRARAGSIRSPIWRGGGNVFGPTGLENFKKKVNKKVKKQSLFMALSSKDKGNEIIVLEDIKIKKPKTKEISKILEKLPVEGKKLIILSDNMEAFQKSARNLPDTEITYYKNLNTFQVLKSNHLIFVGDAMDKMIEYFGYQTQELRPKVGTKK